MFTQVFLYLLFLLARKSLALHRLAVHLALDVAVPRTPSALPLSFVVVTQTRVWILAAGVRIGMDTYEMPSTDGSEIGSSDSSINCILAILEILFANRLILRSVINYNQEFFLFFGIAIAVNSTDIAQKNKF